MFKIVVAFDKNKTIGYEGWMPWDIPEDLQHFKDVTLNSNIIMGTTTFNGLKKPLPKRVTYVLSSAPVSESENVKWISNLEEFINQYKDSDQVFYVCGGASIYKQFLPYTSEMIVSYVNGDWPSDTVFPEFNDEDFEISDLKEYADFTVKSYKRIK